MHIHNMTFQEAHGGGSQWLCIQMVPQLEHYGKERKLSADPPRDCSVSELEL